ncbi:MAG: GIY-YIG nuclease family protein [Ignavibacteriales bacterium]|nr:GIY-YIG nuclease family protein [Ignavibacteriales bacterium]
MTYYLYILKSQKTDKFYTGISNDPRRRLEFHNSVEKGFTARYRPWEIAFTKEFPDKFDALKAEKKVKSWKSKAMIQKLIDGLIGI